MISGTTANGNVPTQRTALALQSAKPQGPFELSGARGCYSVHQAVAVGQSTSVHLGVFLGAEGFRHTVAIKRLLPARADERAAVAGMVYEARIAAQIHHPNVASVLDLGQTDEGPFVVIEYVLGDTVAGLLRTGGRCPVPVALAIVGDALRGLHAAHVARDMSGEALEIVHRNVCPENILVGVDGAAHVIDFGAAVAAIDSSTLPILPPHGLARAEVTSPEQLMGWPIDGRADVFAMAVVLWELLVGTRPFRNHGARQAFLRRPTRTMPPVSAFNVEVSAQLERVIERALSWSPQRRFDTAAQFAEELEGALLPATRAQVAAYVEAVALSKVAIERAWLGAIHAPYDRVRTPPPLHPALASEPTLRMREGNASKQGVSSAGEMTLPFARVGTLPHPSAWRRTISRYGSKVLAGLVLGCVLLGIRPFRRSRQSIEATPAIPTAARAATLGRQSPPAPEASALPIAHASSAIDAHDPFRLRSPARKSATSPNLDPAVCDPPIAVYDSGVRRTKAGCP